MSQIKIKYFGPIKAGFEANEGFMDIKKVTLFIGNQGTGKSTVTKLISTLRWLEKALIRGDFKEKDLTIYNRFKNKHCAYQNIHNYFKDDTEIEYRGKAYFFSFIQGNFSVSKNPNNGYQVPKIMYVPAERNFVSAVDKPTSLKKLPSTLYTFLDEFEDAKQDLKEGITLPINNVKFEYQKQSKISYISGSDYRIRLSEASSGYQSLVPLYIVTRYLALSIDKETDASRKSISIEEDRRIRQEIEKILAIKNLTDDVRKAALEVLSSRFKSSCFINIVEEPEQNLFPASQKNILFSLLEFANINDSNELLLTTHSPYIVNYLTLSIKGNSVNKKIEETNKSASDVKELKIKLEKVVPISSTISSNETIFYELMDDGKIIRLETYKGLPSDANFLNQKLVEANELFDKLLEIEELCQ